MKPYNRAQLIALLEQALEVIKKMPIKQSCCQCKHYDYMGSCGLVGKYVPKEIIEVGCELFLYDESAPPF